MRVASKAGNRPFKIGHDRPLGLWVLELVAMYATDGQTETDGQKQRLVSPSLRGQGHNKISRFPVGQYCLCAYRDKKHSCRIVSLNISLSHSRSVNVVPFESLGMVAYPIRIP